MFPVSRKAVPAIATFLSHRISNIRPRRAKAAARWGILAVLFSVSGTLVFAQAASANFGPVDIGASSSVIPLTFTFQTSDTLASTQVLTLGSMGLDFADAGSDTCTANTAYIAGQSCAVNVIFTPRFAGNRFGAVVLQDSSGNTMAAGFLQGVGVGPQIVYQPGVQSVLGSGFSEPASVAVDGDGDIFVSNVGSSTLYEMVAVNGEVPPSPTIRTIGSGFGSLLFLAIDAGGNLYVADTENNAVKEILAVNGSIPASPTIKTLGSGFSEPAGVAVDTSGDVYVTNSGNNTVEEMEAVNGSIPASPTIHELGSGFHQPLGVAVDASGNVYVADSGDNAVKEIAAGDGTITTLGSGFDTPYSLTLDDAGDLYVADYGNNAVKEIVAVNGSIPASPVVEKLGSGFYGPAGVAVDAAGNVYVADSQDAHIDKLDFADPPSLTFASTAIGAVSTDSPRTVTLLNFGNASLTFPVPPAGNNPSITTNFTLNSSGASACPLLTSESSEPATLAAGASCQLPISFAPTATGALTGSLALTDNNLNASAPNYASQSITLNGTGTGSFTLSSSASSLTMTQGGSGTSTITITDQNGFTGNVNLSASNLPPGVEASFSTNPASGSSVLTLSANSTSSLAENQTITITGTSGSLTATTTLLLTVNPGPSFLLSSSPSALSVGQGYSGSSTITVTGENGFTGSVSLAASGLPSGVTAAFSPNPTASGSSQLTFSAISSAATGTYTVTIQGTSGALSASCTVSLTVIAEPSFTIGSSVSSGGMSAGSSLTSTITVTPINGFNSAVTLSASGLPSGLTASFAPNPATSTSVLTLTASASMPTESALITITGTSGNLTASTLIDIGITAQPLGFTLSSAPSSIPVLQGFSATTTITITGSGGFAGSVDLAISTSPGFSLPGGVTASFSPNPAVGTSVLTLTTSPSAVPASYNIGITGASGSLSAIGYITLIVQPSPGFSPSPAYFGAASVGSSSSVHTLTYTFGAPVTLGSMEVLTQGAAGLDYSNAGTGTCMANSSYTAGQSCTLNVVFTPMFAGSRNGAALLIDNNGNVIATDSLQGTGYGPQIDFLPGTQNLPGAGFYQPWGVAIDGSGDIFVADTGNQQVKEILAVNGKIPASPTINVLGSGFGSPAGVALDSSGNLYVADFANNAVYELLNAGGYTTMTTLGGGFANPSSVAVDANGNVFVADYSNNAVKEIPPGCSTSACVIALGSGFDAPFSVAVDPIGDIFVADTNNFAVKEITWGSSYTTVNTLFSEPSFFGCVASDGQGNLYVSDTKNNRLLEFPASDGFETYSTLPGSYNNPYGLAINSAYDIYVAEVGSSVVSMDDFSDPPSLTFAAAAIGSTSTDSPQTITVENAGNSPLSFPVPSTGNNPTLGADFTLNSTGSSDCPLITSGSGSAGSLAPGASCELPVSFTPTTPGQLTEALVLTDSNLNAAAPAYATQSVQLTGTGLAATPTISWSNPSAITYGTPLGAAQLNATASVPGTFNYSPAAGAVLGAGTQTLKVTFTPNDITDYTTATATVTLTVNQAVPAITWTAPAAITYGTALSATQLNATSSVAGAFAYSPVSGTVLAAGQQTLMATFTPTDGADYTAATASVTLTVNQAPLTIAWPTPSQIIYGTALSGTQLNASSTAPGTFVYSPAAGTVLGAGQHTLSVTLTPTYPGNYTTATASANVTLTVNKATPSITWATPAAISYGTALSATQLDASSSTSGTFAYSPAAGTVLAPGEHTLTVTFTPTDSTDYTTATTSVTLLVNKATPSITWAAPAAITYGTALSSKQLDASASVGGSFNYSPAAGTVLGAGQQTLTVTFSPSNSTDYATATDAVTLTVNQAAPTIKLTSSASSATLGQTITFTATISGKGATPTGTVTFLDSGTQIGTGSLNGSGVATFSTNALAVGKHSITASYGGNANYTTVTSSAVNVTINR